MTYDPLVKRVLDGELMLADLPPALRAEAAEALRLLEDVNREPVRLSAGLDARVMAEVRRHARSPARRALRWLSEPREIRVRLRPWALGPALAAAAALVLLLGRSQGSEEPVATERVLAKFVLYAPDAGRVALAGTFNEWSETATLLVRADTAGVWTATVALPAGQHQYAFVIDGRHWVVDPTAPTVDDGFGRRNSVISL